METPYTKSSDKILFEREYQDILPERRVHAGKEEGDSRFLQNERNIKNIYTAYRE